MKLPKYMRIQGRELSYRTGMPVGIFILCWRRIRDGVFSEKDAKIYNKTHDWFLKNLPVPPFYGDETENPDGAVTYFKTENYELFSEKISVLISLTEKYGIPYDIVFTDFPGEIIYEDDYQIGAVVPRKDTIND